MRPQHVLLMMLLAVPACAQLRLAPADPPLIDIYTTGQWLPGSMANDSEQALTSGALTAAGFTGNALLPGGVDVLVGANGGVLWDAALLNGFAHEIGRANADLLTMPPGNEWFNGNGNGVRQFIAVFWDDLTPFLAASMKWQVIEGTLIIQWKDICHSIRESNAATITFQLRVYSGVGPQGQFADFVYEDAFFDSGMPPNYGGWATIGYKDWGVTGRGDVQWSFDQPAAIAGRGQSFAPHALALLPAMCDIDGDSDFDLADLSILLANFGAEDDATQADGDLDGDGAVSLADLGLLLSEFGSNCE